MDIELFRKILLGGLIILLIAILYKRLLKFLQGKTNDALYAAFLGDGIKRVEGNRFELEVEYPVSEQVQLFIESPDGQNCLSLLDGQSEAGVHMYSIDASSWDPGKYCCHLISGNQKSMRYFWVK